MIAVTNFTVTQVKCANIRCQRQFIEVQQAIAHWFLPTGWFSHLTRILHPGLISLEWQSQADCLNVFKYLFYMTVMVSERTYHLSDIPFLLKWQNLDILSVFLPSFIYSSSGTRTSFLAMLAALLYGCHYWSVWSATLFKTAISQEWFGWLSWNLVQTVMVPRV